MKELATAMVMAGLIMAPALAAKERPGAAAVLALKDGRSASGELYAVRSGEIVIVSARGDREAYDVGGVRQVELRPSPRKFVRTGALLGFSIGAVVGISAMSRDDHGGMGLLGYAGGGTLVGLIFALPGAGAGYFLGVGQQRTVKLDGLSGKALQRELAKVRKYARTGSLR